MLQGKTAVVTGCSKGIGKETMRVFAKNRCNIFACAHKKTDEFETEIQELQEKHQVSITPIYFDMADNDAVKAAAREIQKAKKQIDILVNIAGIARDAFFQMVTMGQLQETFQVNFFSQILFSQYMVKLMRKSKKGSVIFTSSMMAMDGNKGQLSYSASKAAIIAATKTMAEELGPEGIRVNAVAPGVIKTPMTDAVETEIIQGMWKRSKLQRIGNAEEVANLIMFLASDLSDYITGQVIRIDGGIG